MARWLKWQLITEGTRKKNLIRSPLEGERIDPQMLSKKSFWFYLLKTSFKNVHNGHWTQYIMIGHFSKMGHFLKSAFNYCLWSTRPKLRGLCKKNNFILFWALYSLWNISKSNFSNFTLNFQKFRKSGINQNVKKKLNFCILLIFSKVLIKK